MDEQVGIDGRVIDGARNERIEVDDPRFAAIIEQAVINSGLDALMARQIEQRLGTTSRDHAVVVATVRKHLLPGMVEGLREALR